MVFPLDGNFRRTPGGGTRKALLGEEGLEGTARGG